MKFLSYVLIGLQVISCVDNKKITSEPEQAAIVESSVESKSNDDLIAELRSGIMVYNFEGLDRALLQKNNDTTYVVNFWATWCKPCVKEMPYFEKVGAEYAKDKVKVVFVSLDFPDRLEPLVVPFIEKNKIRSEVVLLDDADANSWIPKVSDEWQGAIPATLMFNNKKRAFFERSFTFEELEKEVQSIL
ncbi:MAG: TlpA family protein disulfide reductase [Bacteroidia bacterium]|nr:TlpA family protein disulfide reductase [Bacteroidia bacterium]MBT8274513.1 TlpA family protein disulfide reductase [Bacteroidia bacterium]NNJ83087.1 TlpA family protein disulfide reductase [Flavobacteriaceae bacterium]NNK54689.1 TlpA family protein disulfide reductase [Flavobacteriaceae bacterium]NNM10077.1 TlpA family protein disulfide reductase [Flavobacteriaceae bacterium]